MISEDNGKVEERKREKGSSAVACHFSAAYGFPENPGNNADKIN